MSAAIFFCYAHEDEQLLNKLKTHLKPLQRQGLIDVWYDREISAGTEWKREIDKHLNTAQIILLLVSPDFMNSDYCYSIEMKRAIEKHERGEACVIPVILRHVYWHGDPLGRLQALPKDAKPITDPSWHNLDIAFYNVAEGIRETTEKLFKETSITSETRVDEQYGLSYAPHIEKNPSFDPTAVKQVGGEPVPLPENYHGRQLDPLIDWDEPVSPLTIDEHPEIPKILRASRKHLNIHNERQSSFIDEYIVNKINISSRLEVVLAMTFFHL